MSGLKEMTDEDLFNASDIDDSEIDTEDEDAGELHNASEAEEGASASEAEEDAQEADADIGGSRHKNNSKKGGAKPEGGEEEDSEAEAEASDVESEADESEAGDIIETVEGSDEDSDSDDENYLQKFNKSMRDDLILNFHPESKSHNYEEIKQLAKVTRNKSGIVVDELHKTIPLLTKYEKTRILGQRAKQIETGAMPLVQVPPNIIDSYLIAKLELAQNKIPFIIRRPLPNGGMEYWYVSDLENL
jgi:DNA-directed RNA polymerase I, II, and III subunit RPABC2